MKHEHRCRDCGKVYPCWGRKHCPGEDNPIGRCRPCRDVIRPLDLEEELEVRTFLLGYEPERSEEES